MRKLGWGRANAANVAALIARSETAELDAKALRTALQYVVNELGVPREWTPGYVTRAYYIAQDALAPRIPWASMTTEEKIEAVVEETDE